MKHILFYNIPKKIKNNYDFQEWLYERVCNGSKISVKLIEEDKELDEEYAEINKKTKRVR